jgi:hypothetical protein
MADLDPDPSLPWTELATRRDDPWAGYVRSAPRITRKMTKALDAA